MVTILLNYALVSVSIVRHFSKMTMISNITTQMVFRRPIIAPVIMTRYIEFSYTNFQSPQGSSSRPGFTSRNSARVEEVSPPKSL